MRPRSFRALRALSEVVSPQVRGSLSTDVLAVRAALQQLHRQQRSYATSPAASSSRAQWHQQRQLSFKSLSPSNMYINATRLQAESMPDDPEKQVALLSALIESGSKDRAKEAVEYYEAKCFRFPVVQNEKAFDLYLAALAMTSEGAAVQKLAAASQRRDAVLAGGPSAAEIEAVEQDEHEPSRPTLTDAQIASAVLSRAHPTADVRVANREESASPIPAESGRPTSASPAASTMTESFQDDKSIPDAQKPLSANPTAPAMATTLLAKPKPTASSTSSSTGSTAGSSGSQSAGSSDGSASIPPRAKASASSSAEPIRVVVEEAKGNLALRAVAWLGRTLFLTFLTLTLLSFIVDQSGMLRGATGRGGPTEFLPPASGKTYKFEDVHGCEEAKAELEEVVEFLKDPAKFSALGGRLPRGVLLTGPPGTGKTLLARAVAGEAGVKFLFASGSEFDEMYVGVGARRVRELFTAAKAAAPAIIFIDELDAMGGKRSPKNMQYQQQTLNELLVQLDGFTQTEGVILIGATNFPEALDKALVRPGRFDRHITVPLPDVRGRLAILKHYMKETRCDPSIDASVLARGTPGFSGAELQNVINQAAVHAARNSKPHVTLKDLEWAKDRVMMGAERKSAVITPEDKRLTAFHEAGHALVAILTKGSIPLHSVTCLPRGASLGLTSFLPEMDATNYTQEQLQARLDVAFGGRVAEEIIYGKSNITTGASSDISQATRIANGMVREYGYSDAVGPVNVGDNETLAPTTRSIIDSEVRRMLEEAKGRAYTLLTEKKTELERLANALVEFETLTKTEVLKVIKGEKIDRQLAA